MHGPVIKISCLFDMCLIFRTYVRAVQRNLTKTVLYNRIFHFKLLVWRQETRQITVMLAMSSSSNCEQRRRFYLQVTTKLWSHQKVFVWNKILVPSLCFPKRQSSKMNVRTVCRVRWLNVWSSNLHTLSHSKYRIPKPLQLYCICRPHRSVFWLAASREAFNRISTNLLLEILLKFGDGISTDIWYREMLLTFGTGDPTAIWYQEILLTFCTGYSTDIWYQEILLTFGAGYPTDIWYRRFYWHLVPGDSTDKWYRRFYWDLVRGDSIGIWFRSFYWHLVQEILLTFGTRRFYWRFGTRRFYWDLVQEILLTFITRRLYWHLVQEILLVFGTKRFYWYLVPRDSTDIWYQEILLTFGTGNCTEIWYRKFYWNLAPHFGFS
jgi:hypothetical protein